MKHLVKREPEGMYQLVDFPQGIAMKTSNNKRVISWLAADSEEHESPDILYAATDTEGTYELIDGEPVKVSNHKVLKAAHITLVAHHRFSGWPGAGEDPEPIE